MIDVILPALNEVEAIAPLLRRMPVGYHPIVVDNGSSDGTAAAAEAGGALVIHEPQRGFGAACFAGLRAATAEVVCFMDADGSLDPEELPLVADPVSARRADLVLGARRPEPGSWPPHARAMNRLLAFELRRRTGADLHDLGPMRAARRADLLGLAITDRRFGWPLEMVLRAGSGGWLIAEVPVSYRPRTGKSKVTGTVLGTLRTVRDMSRALVR
ncbi:MAG: glycosyltransferase family 2 protein [Acidimicrobiales bacterium]